jgi:hypothetical protein
LVGVVRYGEKRCFLSGIEVYLYRIYSKIGCKRSAGRTKGNAERHHRNDKKSHGKHTIIPGSAFSTKKGITKKGVFRPFFVMP